MTAVVSEPAAMPSPLERFVQEYIETAGGAWEVVEPQVYDVLLPPEAANGTAGSPGTEVVRLAFDPEALPEYPGAQLASFGTPLVEHLLSDAIRRGHRACFYFLGLNLSPHGLAGKARRALTLPPNLAMRVERVRALHFAQAVYWFQSTFVSDQKEHEIFPVALDLHYRRPVRHVERLLDPTRLSEHPALPLPEADRASAASAYPIARADAVRTLAPLANARARELHERMDRQIARMTRYYADLRHEIGEAGRHTRNALEAEAKAASRREAIDREERLRIAELRQKNSLQVSMRVLILLLVQQPKLSLRCRFEARDRTPGALDLVWDPLTESLEAAPCPSCRRPTFSLALTRKGTVVCAACAGAG